MTLFSISVLWCFISVSTQGPGSILVDFIMWGLANGENIFDTGFLIIQELD